MYVGGHCCLRLVLRAVPSVRSTQEWDRNGRARCSIIYTYSLCTHDETMWVQEE